MASKKNLYIFLHIPKTGGTTFSEQIQKYLKKEDVLDVTQIRYGFEKRDFNSKTLKNIRVILGHASYYGIHTLFPHKTPRYIIFLRDPAERIVSAYNFEMRVKEGKNLPFWKWYSAQPKNEVTDFLDLKYRGKEGTKANISSSFLKIFYKIFSSKKVTYFFQSIFKKYHSSFLSSDKKMSGKLQNSKKLLDKCWNIGIIPWLDEDLKFLFKEIGVPTTWEDANVTEKSKKFFSLDDESRKIIYKDNKYDKELFDYALHLKKQDRKDYV